MSEEQLTNKAEQLIKDCADRKLDKNDVELIRDELIQLLNDYHSVSADEE